MEDEYMKRVRERFYKTVRETNWGCDGERVSKSRGRKTQFKVRIESKPRSEGEKLAFKNKFIK
jgi:hypothetical protein